MNNNFREGLKALKEISDPESMKLALEKITGKKLADYEGIDALVGALMRYYNDEVKKKQNKQDNTLKTIAKEIVPAINEINEKVKEIPIDYLEKGNVSTEFNSAEKIEKLFKGNSGIDNIQHIQDNIIKEVGKGYVDNQTGKLYRCIKQAPANIITPNAEYFVPADNMSNSRNNNNSKWRNVISSRKPNTNYTNNNSYPIHVSVAWLTGTNSINAGYLTVDGVITACEVNQGGSRHRAGVWTVVPPKGVYQFIGPTPDIWSELY